MLPRHRERAEDKRESKRWYDDSTLTGRHGDRVTTTIIYISSSHENTIRLSKLQPTGPSILSIGGGEVKEHF